jgi:hypothetical protein
MARWLAMSQSPLELGTLRRFRGRGDPAPVVDANFRTGRSSWVRWRGSVNVGAVGLNNKKEQLK